MAIFKENKKRTSLKGFRQLLPSSTLSLLSPIESDYLLDYETGLRDSMFSLEGGRLGFYLLCALDSDRFKTIVLESLKTDAPSNLRRYEKQWKNFLRLLFVHAVAPQDAEPIPSLACDKYTGDKCNINRWLMLEDGWLLRTGWKNHFRISPKGAKLVESCIKQCEREYSEYLVGQLSLKRDRMGDLSE